MLKLLACAQGHYWETSLAEETDEAPTLCPVCGLAAETMPLLDLAPSSMDAPIKAPIREPLPLHEKDGRPIVAGYEILADLGKGPTGIHHYRARQVLVNRTVTLKVVLAREDPGQLAWGSLRGEAAALGRLAHPNIIQILDAGERERQLFFNAVEYVEGPTLAEMLNGKPLPLRQALILMETLARAVHQAHEKKILHRTLKPASILLQKADGENGQDQKAGLALGPNVMLHAAAFLPKITDFGLARRAVEGDTGDMDLQGEMPCYLAPEQAWGRAKEIGPATDVYALGAILYELISARPPFRGATATETLDAIQTKQPQPLKRFRSRVARDVEAVCRKCLAKQPRRRYPSALALAEDLRRCADGRPVSSRTPGNGERLGKWLRRNARSVALLMLGLVMGVLFALLSSQTSSSEQTKSIKQLSNQNLRLQSQSKFDQTRAQETAANYHRYLLLAQRAADDRDAERGLEMLSHCPPQLRHWEWSYLHGSLRAINKVKHFNTDFSITCMDFSSDGRFLAAGSGGELGGRGEVRVWDCARQGEPRRWAVSGRVHAVAFSPDSNQLALVHGGGNRDNNSEVQLRNLHTQQIVFNGTIHDCRVTTIAFSADQSKLVAAGADSGGSTRALVLLSRDGRMLFSRQVAFHPGGQLTNATHARLARLSPDGTNLALINAWGSDVVLLSGMGPGLESQITNNLRAHEGTILALDYDEPSEMLATAGSDRTILLWDLVSPNPEAVLLSGHKKAVTGVSFSNDGKRLASCSADGTVRIWDVEEGLELLRLPGFEEATAVKFRPAQPVFDIHGGNRNGRVSEQLAIVKGNTVVVLEPPSIIGNWQ